LLGSFLAVSSVVIGSGLWFAADPINVKPRLVRVLPIHELGCVEMVLRPLSTADGVAANQVRPLFWMLRDQLLHHGV
jgi:hypothetical protein